VLPRRRVDLNLFRIFEAVMCHRSVAGASRELTITPSAVSHALARLRRQLDDQLFVAVDNRMVPTPRAIELAPIVRDGLNRFLDVVRSRPYEPSLASRTFRVGMSDYATETLLPSLIDQIKTSAPKINLRILSLHRLDLVGHLDGNELDIAVGCFARLPKHMRRLAVAVESELLVVRTGHPLTAEPATMQRILAFPIVVAELSESEERLSEGFIDEQGAACRGWLKQFLSRKEGNAAGRVAISVPHYSAAVKLASSSDMVTILPRTVALREAKRESLAVLELPLESFQMTVEAVWHQRADQDTGLRWLAAEILEARGHLSRGQISSRLDFAELVE